MYTLSLGEGYIFGNWDLPTWSLRWPIFVRKKYEISIQGCHQIGALLRLTTMSAQDSGRVFERQSFDNFAYHIAA